MTAIRIDGKAFAETLRGRVRSEVSRLRTDHGLTPGLAVAIVGEDPASKVYVGMKSKQTVDVGMRSFKHELPDATSETELLALVEKLNADPAVHGILVQLPLPDQIDEQAVIGAIDPAKDVDGFHVVNSGKLATGDKTALVPCTPLGCLMMLKDRLGSLVGLDAIVIGRSNIVGKPMAALLTAESCTVTIAHSRTGNIKAKCRAADIVVAAVGRPEMVRGDWIKPGATVIDVGVNRIDAPERGVGKTRLVGDVAYEEAKAVAGAITPVPGGVGPMTIACLLRNTVVAARRRAGLGEPDL